MEKHRVVNVLYDFPWHEGVIGAPETHVTIEPVEDELEGTDDHDSDGK